MKTFNLEETDPYTRKSEESVSALFRQVEEYVRFAETLPTELFLVKIYLGYDTSNEPVLRPESMLSLFTQIRSHAEVWKEVSAQTKNQLRELSITADQVVKDGNGLLRGLDALDPIAKILDTVGTTSLKPSDFEGTDVALDESIVARLNSLSPYIESLQSTSLDSLGDTRETDKQLADFRTQTAVLEALVADKMKKLLAGNSESIGKEETVGPMIEAYKEACDRIVAEFGEGSEAAIAIRKQIEMTLEELTSREADLQSQQRLTYAVGRLFVHLQGLGYAMLDAQSALTHLWLSSSTLCTRLNSITSDLDNIDTEDSLLGFYINYKIVLIEWIAIREDASAFYNAF